MTKHIILIILLLLVAVDTVSANELIYNGDFEIISPLDSSNPDGWELNVGGRNDGTSLYKIVENEYYYSGSHSIKFSLDGYSNQYAYATIKSPLINTVQGDLYWYQTSVFFLLPSQSGKRKGKTPIEILTGKTQDKDWLELLVEQVPWEQSSLLKPTV